MNSIDTDLSFLDRIKECKAPRWAVVFLNDDITTMDFVVRVLIEVFNKSTEEALNLMLKVHHENEGVAGVYSYEVAKTKMALTYHFAKQEQYPLQLKLRIIE